MSAPRAGSDAQDGINQSQALPWSASPHLPPRAAFGNPKPILTLSVHPLRRRKCLRACFTQPSTDTGSRLKEMSALFMTDFCFYSQGSGVNYYKKKKKNADRTCDVRLGIIHPAKSGSCRSALCERQQLKYGAAPASPAPV